MVGLCVVGGGVITCNLEKSRGSIFLESQDRLSIDCVFQGLSVGHLLIID